MNTLLEEIQAKIRRGEYEYSGHALDQSVARRIRLHEVEEAITSQSEVIEDYPDDKYGPSCLVLGFTLAGRGLHVQCSYPNRPVLKIITLYEPDPSRWQDYRTRRIRQAERSPGDK